MPEGICQSLDRYLCLWLNIFIEVIVKEMIIICSMPMSSRVGMIKMFQTYVKHLNEEYFS